MHTLSFALESAHSSAKLGLHSVWTVACYSEWTASSTRNNRDWISHVTCVEISLESTGLRRICCPTVGVPVYTWIICMCPHTQTHIQTRQHQRKSTHNRRGRLLFFSLSFFLFFFFICPFLTSCNTGKICKPWSGNSGFNQWEHSVIPAGPGRRVNTFFSQARNSLAG